MNDLATYASPTERVRTWLDGSVLHIRFNNPARHNALSVDMWCAVPTLLEQAQRDKMSPDEVLALMKRGNKRFSSGQRKEHNYLAQQRSSAAGQYPVAILLSCIDSRAPAETIMDLRIGDVFATVYRALGIDPSTQVRDAIGRPFAIAGGNGRPIEGLF